MQIKIVFILKISRTNTDIEHQKDIHVEHLAEAIHFRNLDRGKLDHRRKIFAITNTANAILPTPFKVAKARLTFERSFGFTIRCS